MLKQKNKTELHVVNGEGVENFTFRHVQFENDLDLLYDWMHQKHIAPFWKLNLPILEFKEWLRNSIEAKHKDIYIGSFNEIPVCYLVAYSVKDDPIREYYDYQTGDLGMHLLIGPQAFLNKDDGLSIIRAMIIFLFHQYGANRIIGEPDIRNRIVIPILNKLGGKVIERIDLHHKKASLIIGEKVSIEKKLKEMNIKIEIINKINSRNELIE
ncbi:IucA/IucC protein [Bacillus sp. SA1-12]|uniref:GNAT family N-acetyltransferase n=1 Tax=Bacillus sp. SA1-12 TaxID=1455638 RepID=UPI000626EF66|nr:GNAT family N-acetyltransferase [Bacillus sp. SA1-12]KKI90405.1 IucA/IucC protein [Bacillus sp. SA1-12]